MKRWAPLAPLAVIAALGLLFAGYALHHDPQVQPDALVGHRTPDLALTPLAGGDPTPIDAAAKGPALINLFASWCAPCAAEQPQLLALKAHGVRIVGVAYKDEPNNTRLFLRRTGDPFSTVLTDPSGDAGVEFGITGVPESFLVGADGIIFAKHSGPMTPDEAQAIAARLKAGR